MSQLKASLEVKRKAHKFANFNSLYIKKEWQYLNLQVSKSPASKLAFVVRHKASSDYYDLAGNGGSFEKLGSPGKAL